jgi:hypothetical protein
MIYWPAYDSLFSVSLVGWHSIATTRAWQDNRQQIAIAKNQPGEEIQNQGEVIEERKEGKFE